MNVEDLRGDLLRDLHTKAATRHGEGIPRLMEAYSQLAQRLHESQAASEAAQRWEKSDSTPAIETTVSALDALDLGKIPHVRKSTLEWLARHATSPGTQLWEAARAFHFVLRVEPLLLSNQERGAFVNRVDQYLGNPESRPGPHETSTALATFRPMLAAAPGAMIGALRAIEADPSSTVELKSLAGTHTRVVGLWNAWWKERIDVTDIPRREHFDDQIAFTIALARYLPAASRWLQYGAGEDQKQPIVSWIAGRINLLLEEPNWDGRIVARVAEAIRAIRSSGENLSTAQAATVQKALSRCIEEGDHSDMWAAGQLALTIADQIGSLTIELPVSVLAILSGVGTTSNSRPNRRHPAVPPQEVTLCALRFIEMEPGNLRMANSQKKFYKLETIHRTPNGSHPVGECEALLGLTLSQMNRWLIEHDDDGYWDDKGGLTDAGRRVLDGKRELRKP